MLNSLPKPAIFAHRGASAHAPENTLAAFKLAVEQGADAIELDAKLSSDGHVVIIHDQTVDRTTPASGRVMDMTAYELTRLDAGSFFDYSFSGEPIPLLEDVLEAVGQQIFINIELTNYASLTDDLPRKAVELVVHYHLQNRVLFSSFNPIALHRVRKLLREASIGLLAFPGKKGWLARSWPGRLLKYQALHPAMEDANEKLVQGAHKRNHRVHVYTVNEETDMLRLFDMKVDGIFTDDPLLARKVLVPQKNFP